MHSEPPNNKQPIPRWSIPERPSSKRSWLILIACICTLLFHLLLISLSHYGILNLASQPPHPKKKPEIIYELALNPPNTQRFVDTNPYLDSQEPPETNNFAAKSQMAAQEIPSKIMNSDIPTIDGDFEGILKIVPDQLTSQDDLIEIAEFSSTSSSSNDASVELKEQTPDLEGPKISIRPQPKPRQRVKPLVGGIRQSSTATRRTGVTAVDAKFNQFGVYLQKMNESIGYQWYLLVSDYRATSEDLCGAVRISYTIDPTGNVIDLKVTETSTSNLLTIICKDSILSLASFGPWNDDMKKILGKEQTFHVGFIIR